MNIAEEKQTMNIVIAGHVDHGKSTIIGRLLADTYSLPEGKLEQVKSICERNSKPFEYAFLIDSLKDEQSQGITIDSARVFFSTEKRNYIIIDAPGHIEFLKNMVTGASRAESALLVIDASEGVQENSRRHGYMISILGISQIAVLVNKMDLVDYSNEVYDAIVSEYSAFLSYIGIQPKFFIPVSGMTGDSIANLKSNISWYKDKTVLEVLDAFNKEDPPVNKPFRMPVQDVYKFTKAGDSRRIFAGTVETGFVKIGDEIIFYPSGKKSIVKTIETFNSGSSEKASAGYATGFTLTEQIYITRGEIASKALEHHPKVSTRMRVSLFWLGKFPLEMEKDYVLKLGTAKVNIRIEDIIGIIDSSNLEGKKNYNAIGRHDVAECIIKCAKPIAFDPVEICVATSRFVIVDDYEIWGGGIILEALEDKHIRIRDKVYLRDYKWEKSIISFEDRSEKFNQKSTLVLITGGRDSGKKPIAKELEARLFSEGKFVYFLGIGNLLYGVDADIQGKDNSREEHIRRLAEIAYILLDAGAILIVTAIGPTQDDLEIIKTSINSERIEVIWVGDNVNSNISYDLLLPDHNDVKDSVNRIKTLLQEKGVIFKV